MEKNEEREPLMFIHIDSIGKEDSCNEYYDKIRPKVIALVAEENKGDYWQGMIVDHPRQAYEDLDYFDSSRTPNKYPFLYFAVQCENPLEDAYIIDYLEKVGLTRI